VGLYSRKAPSDVMVGFGDAEFDAEGRYVEARFDTAKRKLSVISCYFPSGSSGEERQAAKFRFLARGCTRT
jgi:exodeoxyribonuclease-3